jgi:hypothetical protein
LVTCQRRSAVIIYQWRNEKRVALEKLAKQYNGILKPPPRDRGVVSLSRGRLANEAAARRVRSEDRRAAFGASYIGLL